MWGAEVPKGLKMLFSVRSIFGSCVEFLCYKEAFLNPFSERAQVLFDIRKCRTPLRLNSHHATAEARILTLLPLLGKDG